MALLLRLPADRLAWFLQSVASSPGYDTAGGCGPLVLRHHRVETRKGD